MYTTNLRIRCFMFHHMNRKYKKAPEIQKTGQPLTTIPFSVGQEANGQLSKLLPHQLRLISSNPRHKYNKTPMKAKPASSAPEST